MSSGAADLCVESVHVWRGARHVLQGVGLDLRAGESLHVSGANGAGKTTLMRVVSGLVRPEGGSVTWRSRSIWKAAAQYQANLAYLSHEPALKADLTALENLRFMVGLKRRTTTAELLAALDRTGVAGMAHLPTRALSAGQRRRVAMARVLASQAPLWLLDEPYTNLDVAGAALVSSIIGQHLERGGMALVIAHQALDRGIATRCLELHG